MKFKFTYEPTSFNMYYKPYYYVDNKRVSKKDFDNMEEYCRNIANMKYNSSVLITGKRYKSIYYYD